LKIETINVPALGGGGGNLKFATAPPLATNCTNDFDQKFNRGGANYF
jgi:hypothetical protein